MKQNKFLFLILSVLVMGGIIFSCNKALLVEDTDGLMLKAATSNLTNLELLGKNIYFDKISEPGNMACADCHSPSVGFTGPLPGVMLHGSVYRGAVAQRHGDRRPPSAAYGGDSPVLHFDDAEGVWIGGMFWDGRATGWTLDDPLAEQALGPFLNPAEQNNPDPATVLQKIAGSKYAGLWVKVYGPMSLDPADVHENYVKVGRAIAAYERSSEVSAFTSKFDCFLAGTVELTEQEAWGFELFNGKGMCSACHLSDGPAPLFTDYTFDNLGVPKNPENPMYAAHPDFVDPGLGGFLKSIGKPEAVYMTEMGKHKVPTLRNVDKRPGLGFPKDYSHNGYFKSLKEIVHFYNTRDTEEENWPAPEVAGNVNSDELGNLGLSSEEEDAIVAFMGTLSDGFKIKK
jgi:cytochrome c peroxidase